MTARPPKRLAQVRSSLLFQQRQVAKLASELQGYLEQCLSTGCIVHPRVYQNFPGVYQLHGVYRGVPDVCSSKTVNCSAYVLCSSAVCKVFTHFKTVFIGWCALSVVFHLFVCDVGQMTIMYSYFFFKCNIREYAGKKCLETIALA